MSFGNELVCHIVALACHTRTTVCHAGLSGLSRSNLDDVYGFRGLDTPIVVVLADLRKDVKGRKSFVYMIPRTKLVH